MSQLREQVRVARADYAAVSYPGDLAEETLPQRPRLNWARWTLLGGGFGAGSLAAAAAIALALVNFLPATHEHPADVLLARVAGGGTFASLSQLPERLSRLTTVVPVETLRSTLHLLGLPVGQDSPDNVPAPQPHDPAAA